MFAVVVRHEFELAILPAMQGTLASNLSLIGTPAGMSDVVHDWLRLLKHPKSVFDVPTPVTEVGDEEKHSAQSRPERQHASSNLGAVRNDLDMLAVSSDGLELSKDESAVAQDATPGLSCFVDVFDRVDLYDRIDNSAVVRLSCLGQKAGFASVDSVQKSTGISLRRMLKSGVTALDLATAVIGKLCRVSESTAADFSAILLCHSGVDDEAAEQLAAAVERYYRLPPHTVRPYNFGCSGFLKVLQEGTLLLADRRSIKRIALLNVETPETWHDGSDRLFCGIVSAGATGVVLERNTGMPIAVIHAGDFAISPSLRPNPDPLFRKETGQVYTFRGDSISRTVMRMNAETVFLNSIELMLNNLRSAVASIDLRPGQRVIVIPHQPSGKLLKALIAAARLEYPNFEFLNNLNNFGNTISATVPTIMARLPQVIEQNGGQPIRNRDLIILVDAGICMEEIADHMSAGYACLEWVSAETSVARHESVAMMR